MKLQRYDIYGGYTDLDGTNIDLTHPDDNGRWVYAKDAMKSIADRDAEIARLRAELDAAKAVIDKLPKTADGVVITPRDGWGVLWRLMPDGRIMRESADHFAIHSKTGDWIAMDDGAEEEGELYGTKVSDCYSTREAALAAKENPNAKA